MAETISDREKELEQLKEIFTLENAINYYKKYSKEDPYSCTWVDGMEGEMIQFAYKSGEEIVVERIHIDDLEDAGDWDHVNYKHGTEMIFSKDDLVKLILKNHLWKKGVK